MQGVRSVGENGEDGVYVCVCVYIENVEGREWCPSMVHSCIDTNERRHPKFTECSFFDFHSSKVTSRKHFHGGGGLE